MRPGGEGAKRGARPGRASVLPSLILLVHLGVLACATPDPDELGRCPSGPPPEVAVANGTPSEVPADVAARGLALFEEHCAKCHSTHTVDRSSSLFRGYPRLDCPAYQRRASTAYLTRVISEGGLPVGLDEAMKPFAEVLSPDQIADVVAYLQRAPSPGP